MHRYERPLTETEKAVGKEGLRKELVAFRVQYFRQIINIFKKNVEQQEALSLQTCFVQIYAKIKLQFSLPWVERSKM